jgi:hypothetical protein
MLRNSSYLWMPRNRKKPGNPSYLEGEDGNGPSDGILWIAWIQGGKHEILESCGILWNLPESNGIQWNPPESMESDGILQNLVVFSLKALGCTLLQENLWKYVNN